MRKVQLVLVAGLASALTALAAVAGLADAAPPTNSQAPTIAGAARDSQTLTADEGAWQGNEDFTISYQWQRCDASGASCSDLSGATAPTYTVQTADVNNRLRVRVTGTAASGSNSAVSQPTAQVTPPEGATRLSDGRFSIPVASVSLPHRLVISGVEFAPAVLRSRAPFTGRFRVTDTRGYVVRDATVLVTGVPLGWIVAPQEVTTNVDGLATLQLQPTRFLRLVRSGSMVMFIRARKQGDSLLAGVSSRRLVRVRTARPS
jgi:hypothetical protein